MARKLFGTDGIRGVAGVFPLGFSDTRLLGRCAGRVLRSHIGHRTIRVLMVRDTRASGIKMADQLAGGFQEEGIDVYDAGVLCTPAVAYLVQAHRFDSGVVISASHNPPAFNGVKFFTDKGRKWPDTWEAKVESLFFRVRRFSIKWKSHRERGHRIHTVELAEDYERFLLSTVRSACPLDLTLAVDCSNGANYKLAPRLFKKLVKSVHVINNQPNGKNINVRCGSQFTAPLVKAVKQHRCDLGVAFDGDGDRVIVIDEKGRIIDGDFIIALLARHLLSKKELKNKKAVITVMSNLGLKKALQNMGVRLVETPVGDRYVSEAMRRHHSVLGGEQSGHIILGRYLPSGDGLLTAIHVLAILAASTQPMSKLIGWIKKYPQVLLNVKMKEKIPIRDLNGVGRLMQRYEDQLGDNGRILVRYSGTEPLLRIMIEGTNLSDITKMANALASEAKTSVS